MSASGEGLTALTTDELKTLLRVIHNGQLPCPVTADTLTCVGFQFHHDTVSGALRGMEKSAAISVLVCVIAERNRANKPAPFPPVRDGVANVATVEEQVQERDEAVRWRRRQLGAAAGSRQLGCSHIELPPGQRSWPFHAHMANEEGIFILQGRPMLRLGSGTVSLQPGDYVAFPAGSEYAHQLVNGTEGTTKYLCFSTMVPNDVCLYPDSNKVGVFGGSAPGGDDSLREITRFYRNDADVDYWSDEP